MGYSHFSRPAYEPVRYGLNDWIWPSGADSPSTGAHPGDAPGGPPAEVADSSLAPPVALGMFDSVTWMPGWVALNLLTIWLSSVSVLPDHMVCQVMFTTPDEEPPPDDAAGPEQAARASPAQAAITAGTAARARLARLRPTLRPMLRSGPCGRPRRRAYIFSITRCSFPRGVHQVPAARVGPDPRRSGGGPALFLTISLGSRRREAGRATCSS